VAHLTETLGQRIREARLHAGMTQAALARAIGTTERNIVRWETSKNQPRAISIAAIAQATGADLSSLMNGDGEGDDDEEPG
jgi:transcriptional regulator with XRE-family HTH domain